MKHTQASVTAQQAQPSSPGGRDCFNLSALSESCTDRVYRYLLHRTLNLVIPFVLFFLILTLLASFLLAVKRKSLISLISLGCSTLRHSAVWTFTSTTLERVQLQNTAEKLEQPPLSDYERRLTILADRHPHHKYLSTQRSAA